MLHIISFLTGRYELDKLTSLPMCSFIAQSVEHRTDIAEVTGSNPVEALIFFRLLLSNFTAMIILHFHLQPQFIYELFRIYLTSFHSSRGYELNKVALLPLHSSVGRATGIAEVTGSNPVEALIFIRLLLSNCLNWKIYCDIIHITFALLTHV